MDIRTKAVQPTSVLHLRDANDNLMFEQMPDPKDTTFAAEDREQRTIDNPDKPVQVVLYGPGSKQFARAQQTNTNRAVDRLKRKGKTDQNEEEKRKENAEFLAR